VALGFFGFLGVALAGFSGTGTLAGEALVFGLKSNTVKKVVWSAGARACDERPLLCSF
jgi:hypothetical protein